MCEGDGKASLPRSIVLAPCSLFCQFRARSSNLSIRVLSPPSMPPTKAAAETPSDTQERTDTRTHIHAHSKTHSSPHSYRLTRVFSLMQLKGTHRHTYTHVCANSLMHSLIHSLIPSHAHSPTYQKTPPHIHTHFLMRHTDMDSPTLMHTITHTCANAL